MSDAPNIGHNQPPESTPLERAESLVATANKWSAERPAIVDAEQAGIAQAYIGQLRANTEDIEAAQKEERAPHDLAIVAIRAKYRKPLELLGIALDRMKRLADAWLSKERDRLAAEETERKRQAAEARQRAEDAAREAAKPGATVEAELAARDAEKEAAAAAKEATKKTRPQIRGEFSERAMSFRTHWRAEVTDEREALQWGARTPGCRTEMLEVVTKHASAFARESKDIGKAPKGVRFVKEERAA